MKNLLFAAWKNSSLRKIGQFELFRSVKSEIKNGKLTIFLILSALKYMGIIYTTPPFYSKNGSKQGKK
jgi:predicted AAA+ superfamily ATPase